MEVNTSWSSHPFHMHSLQSFSHFDRANEKYKYYAAQKLKICSLHFVTYQPNQKLLPIKDIGLNLLYILCFVPSFIQ